MKERKKRSVIWNTMADDEFREMVANSKTYGEMLRHFDLVNKGGNQKTLRRRIVSLNIDDSHITKGIGSNKGKKFVREKISLEQILTINSTFSRSNLKKRLIKEGLLKTKCYICGLTNFWNNKPLSLVIDHINGIYNDNRLENLRLLCPNCNSQTETFAGKKIRKRYFCKICKKEILKRLTLCSFCNKMQKRKEHLSRRKCIHPSKEILKELIKNKAMESIGKEYGVSGNAVKKWAMRYGIFEYSKFKHKEKNTVPAVGVEPTCTN